MHGGDKQSTLADSESEVRLIRFRLDKNPNGPDLIEHGQIFRARAAGGVKKGRRCFGARGDAPGHTPIRLGRSIVTPHILWFFKIALC